MGVENLGKECRGGRKKRGKKERGSKKKMLEIPVTLAYIGYVAKVPFKFIAFGLKFTKDSSSYFGIWVFFWKKIVCVKCFYQLYLFFLECLFLI